MLEIVRSPSFSILDENMTDGGLTQRRIRHITAIQVRNLTPFPVRDAFASALAQPSGQSQFNPHGQLSDDLDLTLSRRRSRRISVNSLWSMRSEEGSADDRARAPGTPETRGRRRAGSRVSLSGAASLGPKTGSSGSLPTLVRPASSAPTIRPSNRHRTASITSSTNSPFVGAGTSAPLASSTSIGPFSVLSLQHSQANLEKVIKSRLVETFIAITIPPTPTHHEEPLPSGSQSATLPQLSSLPLSPSTPPRSAPPTKDRMMPVRPKSSVSNGPAARPTPKSSPLKPTAKPASTLRRETQPPPRATLPKPISSPQKSLPKSFPRLNGKQHATSSVTPRGSSTPSPPSSPRPKAQPLTTGPPPPPLLSTPDYLSPIHRPSTNPSFAIEAGSGLEFQEWTDLAAHKLKIELWGKVRVGWRGEGDVEWSVLEEWNIDLADLVPLPEELASNTSSLPSNTLLITLAPSGQVFYLPPPRPPSRTPSPSAGYASDPESEVRRVKQVEELTLSSSMSSDDKQAGGHLFVRRRFRGNGRVPGRESEPLKTAGWKDLFNLVTLQSCILDNQTSLANVMSEIDQIMKEDVIGRLKREVSERELRMGELEAQHEQVRSATEHLRDQIQRRREQLEERRQLLTLAKEQESQEVSEEVERDEAVLNANDRLRSLRANLPPTRTTLLTTLSAIYPIELMSPPDLLYTILDVPLPIPLSASDPGPPLALASHKEVTEDAVATALGYVAQVVQLMAAYLGKGLVYPVMCVGSRSLIRDGISAMVGPRMFPLYSKGVDTYRFEYGVFLLNKNIEMLMSDRDLRAMDMRHTLPNLKNLLLTLTTGEGAPLRSTLQSRPSASVDSLVSLPADGPSSSSMSTAGGSGSAKGSPVVSEIELPPESLTPPESGSITPTATVSESSRKSSRAFFSPFAGFLRVRYPSATSWTTTTTGGGVGVKDEESGGGSGSEEHDEDEEDRRTIRGVVIGERDGSTIGGEGVNGEVDERSEKVVEVQTAVAVAVATTHVDAS